MLNFLKNAQRIYNYIERWNGDNPEEKLELINIGLEEVCIKLEKEVEDSYRDVYKRGNITIHINKLVSLECSECTQEELRALTSCCKYIINRGGVQND